MAFVITLTAPTGEKYFGSKADPDGLRYRAAKIEDAEHFPSQEAADRAILGFRQIKEDADYSYQITEA
jgi:hypothetical protein